jgi:hypothetical protein
VVDQEAANALAECVARIRQLEEENAHLRQAAKTFGDLAERLKNALDLELGRAADGLSDDAGRASVPDSAADPHDDVTVHAQPPVRLVK